jgi:hypothetical protein
MGVAFVGVDHTCGHVGLGTWVAVDGCGVRGERGCECCDGFIVESRGDGFPSASAIALGEEELYGTVVSVIP